MSKPDNTQELRKLDSFRAINSLMIDAKIKVGHREQHIDYIVKEVLNWHNKRELQARIDENNRWRTILVPSYDYNTADMDDFNDRVVELKQELEKL